MDCAPEEIRRTRISIEQLRDKWLKRLAAAANEGDESAARVCDRMVHLYNRRLAEPRGEV